MFSGIIEAAGKIQSIRSGSAGARIAVDAGSLLEGVKIGDSIAVNGACLTVVAFGGGVFEADVSPETLRLTNLGALQTGDHINLDLALALGDRMGGHLVTGHIDGLGRIKSRRPDGESIWLTIEAPHAVMRYVVPPGSVAVDGISLTVFDCRDGKFTVSIIPFTLSHTNFHSRKTGDAVNLECDMIGKYVVKTCESLMRGAGPKPGISMDFLKQHGFV